MRRALRGGLALGSLLGLLLLRPAAAVDGRNLHVDDVDYRVVDIDLAHETLEAHWRDPAGTAFASIDALRRWGEQQGRTLRFAANAGIYDRQFQPLGLYIEDGTTLRPLNTAKGSARSGNFSMQPNGVFYVDRRGRAGVMTTQAWHEHAADARLATQSGPMLVIDGEINAAFVEESESLKWRSGVCAKTPQHVHVVVSQAPVTFHAFARVFRDELGCRDALYLDGTLSQIYTDEGGYAGAPAVMVKPYAGMLAVFGDR
ncbi:MAG TPA: phosphodiester glycosidase family protein [Dokdonella sp.]